MLDHERTISTAGTVNLSKSISVRSTFAGFSPCSLRFAFFDTGNGTEPIQDLPTLGVQLPPVRIPLESISRDSLGFQYLHLSGQGSIGLGKLSFQIGSV